MENQCKVLRKNLITLNRRLKRVSAMPLETNIANNTREEKIGEIRRLIQKALIVAEEAEMIKEPNRRFGMVPCTEELILGFVPPG
jgi:hypothetical protein